jgi:REP element-mobilizing transposase RayT
VIVSEARPSGRATQPTETVAKADYIDFQTRTQPLGFLITFRCYGTWLHGEKRGSVDRHRSNRYGTPGMPANEKILREERLELRHRPVRLTKRQRGVVKAAIEEVCKHRQYCLYALNVRKNHAHAVVNASRKPEHIMSAFKSYSTRKLREANLLAQDVKPWARHGSTPYLWTEERLLSAVDYVLYGQDDEPFR